jgi:glutathione S-transferase
MHLVVANKLHSSWSLRPWILMRALGISFTEETIPMYQADSKARMLAKGPTGKCPVLIDGDVTVWESLAIIEYVAEKFPGKGVWPADAKARAHARSAANEMHAGFQPLRQKCPMNLRARFAFKDRGPEVAESVARIEALWREARARFGSRSAQPFLYGAFCGADAMYAPVVTRLDTYQIPVAAETRAYMDALLAHPAFVAWRTDALAEPAAWNVFDRYEEGETPVEIFKR